MLPFLMRGFFAVVFFTVGLATGFFATVFGFVEARVGGFLIGVGFLIEVLVVVFLIGVAVLVGVVLVLEVLLESEVFFGGLPLLFIVKRPNLDGDLPEPAFIFHCSASDEVALVSAQMAARASALVNIGFVLLKRKLIIANVAVRERSLTEFKYFFS